MNHPSLASTDSSPARWSVNTDTVEAPRRLDYWLSLIGETFNRLECQAFGEEAMSGSIETVRIGAVELTHLRANGQKVRRTASLIAESDDDHVLLQIQREGRCVLQQDGRTAVALPGDLVLYDSVRPYELLFDDLSHDAWILRLTRGQLEAHVGGLQDLTATTLGSGNTAVRTLVAMLGTLHDHVHELHPASVHSMSEAVTSTVAASLRSLPKANVKKASNLASYHLTRVKAFVQKNLRDPDMSIASIAAAMQMSPDSLCRLFRSEPVSLSRWLWQQRLEACRRDLCDVRLARRGVSDIAFSWGFSDAAHFSRSFRAQFGISPRELRGQLFAAGTAATTTASTAGHS